VHPFWLVIIAAGVAYPAAVIFDGEIELEAGPAIISAIVWILFVTIALQVADESRDKRRELSSEALQARSEAREAIGNAVIALVVSLPLAYLFAQEEGAAAAAIGVGLLGVAGLVNAMVCVVRARRLS
jgi:4-hydroxybenzoate polyprenyltransferase